MDTARHLGRSALAISGENLLNNPFKIPDGASIDLSNFSYKEAKSIALESFNKTYLNQLLKQAGGNVTVASSRAGMDRSNFKKIIRKYDIDIHDFRRE